MTSKKQPEVRFKGFEDDWEQRKLGDILKERNERSNEGELISVTINNGILPLSKLDRKDNSSEDKSNYKVVKKGDIAYNSMRMWQGASGYSNYEGIVSPAYTILIPNEQVDGEYVGIYFKTTKIIFEFQKFSQGLTSDTWNLKYPQISQINSQIPDIQEQIQIRNQFLSLEMLITLHQRKLDLLNQMKKTLLNKLFPKNDEKIPEYRFKGFTDDWEQRKLGDIVDVCSGRDYKHLEDGDIPVYGTGGYMLSVSEALSKKDDAIGIGRKGTIDKPYILRAPFWTVDTLFYCVPKKGYNLDFVSGIYKNINWKLMDESTGVPSLSKTTISKVNVIIPILDEQKEIGITSV